MLDLDEAVRGQRRPGLYQIDDMAAQPEPRRQLDRAVQLDAFGLDAAGGEMAAGHLRVFGGDPEMAPAARILLADLVRRRRDGHMAMADIEVERRIDFGIVEFHQHIVAGDAELSRPEGYKGRDIEAAEP